MVLVLRINILLISIEPQPNKQCMSKPLLQIKEQKKALAELPDPLMLIEEIQKPNIKQLPSPTDVVEQLISPIGSNKARAENNHNTPLPDCRNLKTWLTRTCQNAKDETKGRMAIRSQIRAIIKSIAKMIARTHFHSQTGSGSPGERSAAKERNGIRTFPWRSISQLVGKELEEPGASPLPM